jgi:hypothetical protein
LVDEIYSVSLDNKAKVNFFITAIDRHIQGDKFFLETDRPHAPMKDFVEDGHLKKGSDGKISKITPSGYELLSYRNKPPLNSNPHYPAGIDDRFLPDVFVLIFRFVLRN